MYIQMYKQIKCGLAWSVLLLTTSMRHHSGQNVVDSQGAAERVLKSILLYHQIKVDKAY